MKYKPNAYLAKKNSSVYPVKVTIPPYKRSLFGNRTAFMRTTGTADIREARIIRDKVMHEFLLSETGSSLNHNVTVLIAS